LRGGSQRQQQRFRSKKKKKKTCAYGKLAAGSETNLVVAPPWWHCNFDGERKNGAGKAAPPNRQACATLPGRERRPSFEALQTVIAIPLSLPRSRPMHERWQRLQMSKLTRNGLVVESGRPAGRDEHHMQTTEGPHRRPAFWVGVIFSLPREREPTMARTAARH
jgi:hypothetical protein